MRLTAESQTSAVNSQQVVDRVVGRIAAHADASPLAKNQIDVSPYVLGHTFLHRWADKRGFCYSRTISGQVFGRYIWRYAHPSRDDVRDTADPSLSGLAMTRAVTGKRVSLIYEFKLLADMSPRQSRCKFLDLQESPPYNRDSASPREGVRFV